MNKPERFWHAGEAAFHHLYCDVYGRIIGETNILGVNKINPCKFTCTVYPIGSDSKNLGVFITTEHAKKWIENFWLHYDGTLDGNTLTYDSQKTF